MRKEKEIGRKRGIRRKRGGEKREKTIDDMRKKRKKGLSDNFEELNLIVFYQTLLEMYVRFEKQTHSVKRSGMKLTAELT
jgi:hypothetical protein